MRILNMQAVVVCDHRAQVKNQNSQGYVRIAHSAVLVEADPVGRSIALCPNTNSINIFPCKLTLNVDVGYSAFIRVGGKRACLDTVSGFTSGVPPGNFKYTVTYAGQEFVAGSA
jgi:hypothetical protein